MREFGDYLQEKLKSPEEAMAYLNAALMEYEVDKDNQAFLLALRRVAEARGSLSDLAQKTTLNRQHLYRTLSKQGNPRLDTLETILQSLGFRLSVVPLET